MQKKLSDIKGNEKNQTIDLKKQGGHVSPQIQEKLKKNKNNIYKKGVPVQEVKDLSSTKESHFKYIKGKDFKPPPFLGNLIRIGVTGIIILLIINITHIYYKAKRLEQQITASAHTGYSLLIDAGRSASKIEFSEALENFQKAKENFDKAKQELWFINLEGSFYKEGSEIAKASQALIEGGKSFAEAGTYFIEAMEEFNKLPNYFVSTNRENCNTVAPCCHSREGGNPDSNDCSKQPSVTDALDSALEKANKAFERISNASQLLQEIDEDILPIDIKNRVILAKERIAEISKSLESVATHFPALLKLLGDRYPHRYLILLQNNNEIRPSGGFIGSYAIIDVNEGYIEKLEVHDVYDLDGSYGTLIEPPDELKSFTSNWRFRDSNYSPDFALSAQKARWFMQKQGGPSVDTIISINQSILTDLLEITGPVQVGDFGKLNSENYHVLLSYIIESKAWGAEDPKHILKVFIPAFKEALLKEENAGKIGSRIYKAIQQKHIMFYSSDQDIEEFFDTMGVSGKVHKTEEKEDYFSVIHMSTGGTKSEQFIEEKIQHHTNIDNYGTIINEVTISRSHSWDDDIYFNWKKVLQDYGFESMPDHIIDIMGRGRNKVSTRVYVPKGSTLISSSKEEVETKYDQDLRKTYFYTKFAVSPGETDTLTIKYKLPYTLEIKTADTYKIFVEKQPGSRGSIFTKTIQADEELKNLAIYPEETRLKPDGIFTYATNLVYDIYFAGVWGK